MSVENALLVRSGLSPSENLLEPEKCSLYLRHLTRLRSHTDCAGLLPESHVAGRLPERVVIGDSLDAALPRYGDVAGVVPEVYPNHGHDDGLLWCGVFA